MSDVNEMPATLLRLPGEVNEPMEESRAAHGGCMGGSRARNLEPLEEGVVTLHEAVVLILKKM